MICLIYFALIAYISNAWQRPYLPRENHYPSWCDRIVSSIHGADAAQYAIREADYGSIGAEDITDIAKTDHDGVWRKLTIRHTPPVVVPPGGRARRGPAPSTDLTVYVVSINVEENTANGVTPEDSMDDYIWRQTSAEPAGGAGGGRVPNRDVIFVSIQEAAIGDRTSSIVTALLRKLGDQEVEGGTEHRYLCAGSKSSAARGGADARVGHRKIMAFIFFRHGLAGLAPLRMAAADWTVEYIADEGHTKGFVISPAVTFHGIRVQFGAAHFPFTGGDGYDVKRLRRANALVTWWDDHVTQFNGVSILAGDLNFRSRPNPARADGNPTTAELAAYTGPAFVFGGVTPVVGHALAVGMGRAAVPFAAATDTYTYAAANDEFRWSIAKLRAAYRAAHGVAAPAGYLTFDEAPITFNPTCKLKKWSGEHPLSEAEKRALTVANRRKNGVLRGTIEAVRGAAKREYNNEYEEYNEYEWNNMYEAWNRYRELVEEYKRDLSLEHKREKTAERLLKYQRQNVLRAREKVIDY